MRNRTLGWSLLSSGIVTIVLAFLPGGDLWWGVGLCVVGLWALLRNDGGYSP